MNRTNEINIEAFGVFTSDTLPNLNTSNPRFAIWEYTLCYKETKLEIPYGSRILSVQNQNSKITMWCLVDLDAPQEIRRFLLVATGSELPLEQMTYIATAQIENMAWHIFEQKTTTENGTKRLANCQ